VHYVAYTISLVYAVNLRKMLCVHNINFINEKITIFLGHLVKRGVN